MTLDLAALFAIAVGYLSLLFLIAYIADRGWLPRKLVQHPAIYALSLGVYCTTWSYYGSVGLAQDQGLLFLTIYLGPTLAFILAPLILRPILSLVRDYQLTSLADLFAFRFNSQLAGVLVTLFTIAGTLPYIALQIRAVTESARVLTQDASPDELALVFCITLSVFAILFGTRHVSPREKHEGLVVAIAFESLVKLTAIVVVGAFAVFGVFGGPAGLDQWLRDNPEALVALYQPIQTAPWVTLILLSFAAAFLLPRQFHMGFVESLDERGPGYASWAFPLFLLVFNLMIPPILWAGQLLQPATSPDYYVLGITLFSDAALLPTIAFIGGISAASAMVIVTSLALSAMALNHLLLPASYPDPSVDLYRWIAWGRRMIIGLIMLTSYGVYLVLEHTRGLVELGLISFVAVAQFLPGVVGVLYWRRATRYGFLAGLTAGGAVWYTTLLMPLLKQSGFIQSPFNLQEFLGAAAQDTWAFSTFWSLSLNTLLFIAISLATRQDAGERRAVSACFGDDVTPPDRPTPKAASSAEFSDQLSRIIGDEAADKEVAKALDDLHMSAGEHRPRELRRLRDRLERNLSGMVGPMMARMIVDARLRLDAGTRTVLSDHLRFIEDQLERSETRLQGLAWELDTLRRYHRQILQDLPLGACSVAGDGEIVSWNAAMVLLTDVPRRDAVGSLAANLPGPWNNLLGDFLEDEGQHVHKRRITVESRARWFNLHKSAIAAPTQARQEPASDLTGGVVLLLEDLTSVQTLEDELAHSERLASIGRLAAGVAHEIGNPVTGIACITQNLHYETEPHMLKEGLNEILQQTTRITDIVQSLVTFSHGGSPEGDRVRTFNLAECINDAHRLVRLSRDAKQLDYKIDCDQALQVEGDRQRILQVVVNLLSNACDASEPGGRIEVESFRASNLAVIRVRDQGPGIPADLRERVLEPFYTTKEPGEGTGLGLPLAYSIVHDHSGSLRIENRSEGGCTVTVQLPLNRASETVARAS